ncbi:MAG: hypothetical protein ACU0CC_02815 [Sagittula sp.]|uniref:hypothetical protein n=1 Tax=Sagittula sp. TaxID=2038081 RepID=UPI004058ADF1
MKQILYGALALALSAAPAFAAEPLSANAFESYVDGKTLYYGLSGDAYGVEEYLPNRRVRWSFLDGKCKEGYWYEAEGSQICFVYEDSPDPQCWTFFREGSKLRAVFENDPSSTVLYEARQNDEPMMCYGPDVGV